MVVGQQFKNTLIHVSQNYLSQFLNILLIFFVTFKLSVEEVGIFGICKSILSVLEFSNLGSRHGLDFKLPFTKTPYKFINSVLSVNFWISLLLIFLISVYYDNSDISIFIIGGVIFLTFNLIRLGNRAMGKTYLFITQSIFHNIIPIIFQIIGLLLYGFSGLVFGFLLGATFNLIIHKVNLLEIIFTKPNFNKILVLFDHGKSLFILSILTVAVVSIDRLFINHFFGLEFNGYYTFLILVISSFAILPNSITELAINKIVVNAKNLKNSNRILHINFLLILSSSLLLFLVVFFGLNFILVNFFPEYLLIENEIKVSMFYIFPFGLLGILQYNLIAKKRHLLVININLVGTFFYYLILTLIGYNLESENALLFLSYNKILYALIMFLLLFIAYQKTLKQNNQQK